MRWVRDFIVCAAVCAGVFNLPNACAQSLLISSGVAATVPTAISLSSTSIIDNSVAGTVVGLLSTTGGVAPYTYVVTDNTKFAVTGSPVNLTRSSTGTLTAGVSENVDIQVTDANGNVYTTPSPFVITVTAHGSGTQLTTLFLQNTSGSTQATNFVAPMFGHPFKKGDIANGCTTGAPQFQLADGTNVPFSESLKPVCWSDGSLKFAAFMLRVPSTIAGNGTLAINVFNGGTIPSASSRALSDFALGGLDLNVQVTGQEQLSGTWTSDLNQGVTAANSDNYVYMDGDAGKVWRVRASFRQSGADHGQLEGYWYVAALNNSSGALGGFRYLVRVTQPWYDIDTPTKTYRAFSAIGTYNGASLLRDLWGSHGTGKTFTWTSGQIFNSTAHGFETGFLLELTNSGGALPTGLSTGTPYFPHLISANAYNLSASATAAAVGSGFITPSGAGSGTNTATAYPYITQFGSIFTASTSGTWDYIQGAGSVAADSTVRVQFTNTYIRATKMIPPYLLSTVNPTSSSTTSYFPDTAGPVTRYLENTGERYDIGPLTSWAARHVWTQAAVDELNVRVVGLVGGDLPVDVISHSTLTMPVANGRTYSGMPAHNVNFRWYGDISNISGFTAPANTNVYMQGFSTPDSSHIPEFDYYALLITGEPQFMDMEKEFASLAVTARYTTSGTATISGTVNSIGGTTGAQRNNLIGATTYNGITLGGGDLLRTDAWAIRNIGLANGIGAGAYESTSTVSYLADLMNDTWAAATAYRAIMPSFATTAGLWSETSNTIAGISDAWTAGYMMMASNLSQAVNENSGAQTHFNYLALWPAYIKNNIGGWHIAYYEGIERSNGAANVGNAPYIAANDNFGVCSSSVTWSSGTNLFTFKGTVSTYTPGTNDVYIWYGTHYGAVPGGLSPDMPYYVVNVTGTGIGTTFQLSATRGGSAITLTNNSASNSGPCFQWAAAPSTGGPTAALSGTGYIPNILGALNWGVANGNTVDAGTVTDLTTRLHAVPTYITDFNLDPKYAIGNAY